jgi:hypothetical protein
VWKIVGVLSMAVMLSACGQSDDAAAPAPTPSVATATVTATATASVPASKPPKKPAAPRTTPKPAPVTVTATATATVAGPTPPPIVVVPPPAAVSTPWPGTSLSTRYANVYRYDVAMVQQRLNDLGYGPLPVDGDFGPVTKSWVLRYQSDYGLYVDGFVGPVTWRSLFG